MLKINKDFYKEEMRNDYLVTEKQKHVWAVEIDLLNELMELCKKHDIKIYVRAGTLLGAIRHKGFIPWDDDIDVSISRSDLRRLETFANLELKEPYFLQTALTDRRFFFGFGRLRNSDTTAYLKYYDSPDYNNGIFIDLIAVDGLVDKEWKLKKQLFELNFVSKLLYAYYDPHKGNKIKAFLISILKNTLFRIVSYESLVSLYDKIASRYTETSDKLTVLTHGERRAKTNWNYKKDAEELVMIPFEFIKVPAPKNYECVLKNFYSNYMELPPVESRGTWHDKDGLILDPYTPYKEFFKKKEEK